MIRYRQKQMPGSCVRNMRFRPCIDIHNGKVKQIVGGSLRDEGNRAEENFVAAAGADHYAKLYNEYGLTGGHIILLNKEGSEYYEATKEQAVRALHAYPGGMQIGGGINDNNACYFIEEGASHVIVTSFVFQNGRIHFENLEKIRSAVGKEHLVLDLSCRLKNGEYVIVTDRWQKDTDFILNHDNMSLLASYSDEFLIHAVDVEGKMGGIDGKLAKIIGDFCDIQVTYAGGIHSFSDIDALYEQGNGRVDATIGSALSLFGGHMQFEEVVGYFSRLQQ